MVQRYDFGRLRKAKPVAGGAVEVAAALTRVGVLEYRRADGSVQRELRPEPEVFHGDSIESLRRAPVTLQHPREMVDSSNWNRYSVGDVTTAAPKGIFVDGSLVVRKKEAIDSIDSGDAKEVSCGYTCDLDMTPGVYQGQHYDAVQRNIKYNHVALGPANWGRAGSDVALRLDSTDALAYVNDEGDDGAVMWAHTIELG